MDEHELGPALAPNRQARWAAYVVAVMILVPLLPMTEAIRARGPSVPTLAAGVPFILVSVAVVLINRAQSFVRFHVGPETLRRTRRGEVTHAVRYADITSMSLTKQDRGWWSLHLLAEPEDGGPERFGVSTLSVRSLTPLLERLDEEAALRPEILHPYERARWERYPR